MSDSADAADNTGEKSKSQLKREADHLQQRGEDLLRLPSKVLQELQMPEALLSALLDAKKIRSRSAWKRQRQYIGRLMRELDVEAVLSQLERLEQHHHQDTEMLHALEHWRERILAGGDAVIEELLSQKPDADRQRLRQWQRQAARERDAGTAPKAARSLFKYLKELFADEHT